MPRGRAKGHRDPCRTCGCSRDGEPLNSERLALCRKCFSAYVKAKNQARFVTVYLGVELKGCLDDAAESAGVTTNEYVRNVIERDLGLTN